MGVDVFEQTPFIKGIVNGKVQFDQDVMGAPEAWEEDDHSVSNHSTFKGPSPA